MVHLFYYTPKKAFLTLPLTHSGTPGVGRTGHSNQNRKAFGRKDLPLGVNFAHAARTIASRARVFFFNCIEKPFFWNDPFFRAARARLCPKR